MKQRLSSIMAPAVLAAVLSCLSARAAEYARRIPITVTGYDAGRQTLADFPVAVRLSEGAPSGFSYADCAADGSDIRFVAAGGAQLAFDTDVWNPAGESLI